MNRYIDADKLQKDGWKLRREKRGLATSTYETMELDCAPTADVVEAVRCKDCRWYERDIFDREAGVCFNPHKCTKTLGFEVKNEDYCSYGERRQK